MASETSIKGAHSQLIATAALMANGYSVSVPTFEDSHDLVIFDPIAKTHLKAQVKTIHYRKDKGYFVVFSRKNDGTAYTREEADVIIGVYGAQVYLIPNNSQQEYWSKPNEASVKWRQLNVFMN
jgi:hypothetical protein